MSLTETGSTTTPADSRQEVVTNSYVAQARREEQQRTQLQAEQAPAILPRVGADIYEAGHLATVLIGGAPSIIASAFRTALEKPGAQSAEKMLAMAA